MPPRNAKWLADEGWTKKEVQQFIKEYARVPAHWSPNKAFWDKPPRGPTPLSDMDSIPLYLRTDDIKIIVVGGHGKVMGLVLGIRNFEPSIFVTKKVELPANWEKLVAKYHGIVPSYALY